MTNQEPKQIKCYCGHTTMCDCGDNPQNQQLNIAGVSGSLRFSERDVDFAYLCGVFNVSGIDGLHKEIQRLKAIGKDPHDIIEACRKQLPLTNV